MDSNHRHDHPGSLDRLHPVDFVNRWTGVTRIERSASQEHFLDLCRVLGVDTPAGVDKDGSRYAFEKGATISTGGAGWADLRVLSRSRPQPGLDTLAGRSDPARPFIARFGPTRGWPILKVEEDVILSRVLALNGERAGAS